MTNINSKTCKKYLQRINNEIAAGEYMQDHILKDSLKLQKITSEGKKAIGVKEAVDLTIYDVTKGAYEILPGIRFIYLSSMMEAFIKEYIAERDSISLDQVKSSLSTESSQWDRNGGGSKSFYNLPFVFFVTKQKYSIDPSSSLKPVTLELGVLRNCIVHNSGELIDQYSIDNLPNTITFLNNKSCIGEVLKVDKKMMALCIEEYRKIIKLLDYAKEKY